MAWPFSITVNGATRLAITGGVRSVVLKEYAAGAASTRPARSLAAALTTL